MSEQSNTTQDHEFFPRVGEGFMVLARVDCPTAFDLSMDYPSRQANRWSSLLGSLQSSGIESEHIGILLALYPELSDIRTASTLDQTTSSWLNSVGQAVMKVRANDPDVYFQEYIADSTDIADNLRSVGQNIYNAQVAEPDKDIPAHIIAFPTKYALRDIAQKPTPLSESTMLLLAQLGLDYTKLRGITARAFNARLEELDESSDGYADCVAYLFDQTVNERRNYLYKIMGIPFDERTETLDALVDSLPGTDKAAPITRLVALYDVLGRDAERTSEILARFPQFITSYVGVFDKLQTLAGLSETQLKRLKQSSRHVIGDAVNTSMKRHEKLKISRHMIRKYSSEPDSLPNFDDVGLSLTTEELAILHVVYPDLKDSYWLRTRSRIRALQQVVGNDLARLIIQDNLGYLGENHPGRIIAVELPLSAPQKTALRNQIEAQREQLNWAERDKTRRKKLKEQFGDDPALREVAANIGATALAHGLKLDMAVMVEVNPKILGYTNYVLMAIRAEAIVEVCGPERAAQIVHAHPEYLSTHRPVQALGSSLDKETADMLRARIRQINDSRHHSSNKRT